MARGEARRRRALRTPQSYSWLPGMKLIRSGAAGQELVELALLIPLLLLIAVGVLDLGRLFHASITITNSARVKPRMRRQVISPPAGARAHGESADSKAQALRPAKATIAACRDRPVRPALRGSGDARRFFPADS